MKRGARKNVYILPKRKGQVEEFGPGRAGVVMCPNCHSVYFKKAWQKSAEKFLAKRKNGPEVSFKMCPACTMVKRGLYEGIVTIKDAPAKQMAEIIGLVKNFCAHATEKDPMDRLIAIKRIRSSSQSPQRKINWRTNSQSTSLNRSRDLARSRCMGKTTM